MEHQERVDWLKWPTCYVGSPWDDPTLLCLIINDKEINFFFQNNGEEIIKLAHV